MTEPFDIYPILHNGKVYNLITAIDMTFTEVRILINHLEEQQAFNVNNQDSAMGPGKLFSFELNDVQYEVDVMGHEIAIYSRVEISTDNSD